MHYDIYIEDFSRATIAKIERARGEDYDDRPIDDYTRVIGVSLGLGSSSFSPKTSAYWEQAHGASSLDVSGGLHFSLGAEFMTSRFITGRESRNKNLALSLGLRYSSYKTKTALRAFGLSPFEAVAERDDATNRYVRLVSPVNADEDIRFGLLEIPLGVAYRLKKTGTMMFYVHGRLIPGLVLNGSGSITGNALYDGIIINEDPNSDLAVGTLSELRILQEMATQSNLVLDDAGFGAYDVGLQDLDYTAVPDLAGLTFALQLSPTAYFNFADNNPGWGLLVGLDLTYHLGSFLQHNPVNTVEGDAFRYSDESGFDGSSLMNYYLDNLSGFSFGFRLGLFQRLSTEPSYVGVIYSNEDKKVIRGRAIPCLRDLSGRL